MLNLLTPVKGVVMSSFIGAVAKAIKVVDKIVKHVKVIKKGK